MKKNLPRYKRTWLAAIIAVSIGIVFSTVLSETSGSAGTVFIAIGGMLMVSSMNMKKREEM